MLYRLQAELLALPALPLPLPFYVKANAFKMPQHLQPRNKRRLSSCFCPMLRIRTGNWTACCIKFLTTAFLASPVLRPRDLGPRKPSTQMSPHPARCRSLQSASRQQKARQKLPPQQHQPADLQAAARPDFAVAATQSPAVIGRTRSIPGL